MGVIVQMASLVPLLLQLTFAPRSSVLETAWQLGCTHLFSMSGLWCEQATAPSSELLCIDVGLIPVWIFTIVGYVSGEASEGEAGGLPHPSGWGMKTRGCWCR